jgi:alpha-tubulin suppressor-like RCC1 family protein
VWGQLGDNTTYNGAVPPVQVTGLSGVAAIAAGDGYTVALKSGGTAWAWGYNGQGQLGDNTTSNRSMPVPVIGLSGVVVAVAAGGFHTVALTSDNTMWVWGGNNYGQLGDNTTSNRLMPVPVLSGVAAVSAGLYHTVALKSDGTVWAWGHNEYGQIGDNTIGYGAYKSVPAQVQGLSGVFVAVAAGAYYSVALRSDNTVWAWGNNASGQLGINQPNFGYPYPVPRQVTGLTGVVAVAAGFEHTFAIKNDGTVWAWGSNGSGQLGNGTTASEIAPMQVTNFTGFVAVAAGFDFTVALKSDGTVWACGLNQSGELGSGTADFSAHTVPVEVTGL